MSLRLELAISALERCVSSEVSHCRLEPDRARMRRENGRMQCWRRCGRRARCPGRPACPRPARARALPKTLTHPPPQAPRTPAPVAALGRTLLLSLVHLFWLSQYNLHLERHFGMMPLRIAGLSALPVVFFCSTRFLGFRMPSLKDGLGTVCCHDLSCRIVPSARAAVPAAGCPAARQLG